MFDPKFLLTLVLICCALPCACDVSEEPEGTDFIRFAKRDALSGALETAIVAYENGEKCRVDLIAAVHLADPDYYETLNLLFSGYDALLYELVAPEGTLPEPGASDDSILSLFQQNLCRALDLAFQLDAIDYHAPNFVHADLTPTAFVQVMEERGETLLSIILRVLTAQFAAMQEKKSGHLNHAALFSALRHEDSAARLKYLLAQEFEGIEAMFAGLEKGGDGKGSILVGERNKAAIAVLEREMAEGGKKIGIFYGAAHMPDMENRLGDLGFKKIRHGWCPAWQIELASPMDEPAKKETAATRRKKIKEKLGNAKETKKLDVIHKVEDSEFAAILPDVELWVAFERDPKNEFDDPARMVVASITTDGDSRIELLPDERSIVALLRSLKFKADKAKSARACMTVVRLQHAKAHTTDLLPRTVAKNDPDNWFDRSGYTVEKNRVSRITIQFGHEWFTAAVDFDRKGIVEKIVLESTGRRCR